MKNIIPIIILTLTAALATAEDKLVPARLEVLAPNVAEKGEGDRPRHQKCRRGAGSGSRHLRPCPLDQEPGLSQRRPPSSFAWAREQQLAALGLEIVQVKNDAGIEPPAYFRTRMLALEQQHAFLTVQLPKLTPEEIRNRMSGKRLLSINAMGALEEAIDQAGREAGKLTKLALK